MNELLEYAAIQIESSLIRICKGAEVQRKRLTTGTVCGYMPFSMKGRQ